MPDTTPAPIGADAERAAFQQALQQIAYDAGEPGSIEFALDDEGDYSNGYTDIAWRVWQARAALASAAPAAQGDARHPLTEGQIRDWWRSDNGLEECDLCKFEDFAKVVHAVEARVAKQGAQPCPDA